MKTLAERLKIARDWKEWSQAQLAIAADVSTGTVGNIESGVRKSPGSLPKLAKALGISHDWLAYGEGTMNPQLVINGAASASEKSTASAMPLLTQGAIDIARLYDLIPVEDQIRRAVAYSAAMNALVPIVEMHKPAAKQEPPKGRKKLPA